MNSRISRIGAVLLLSLVLVNGASAAEVEILSYFPFLGSVGGGDLVEFQVRLDYVDRCDPFPCYTVPDVYFGDALAHVVSADSTRIVVITPAHAPGEVDVRVEIAGYTATTPERFQFIDASVGPYVGNFEQVLVPVAVSGEPLRGAFGSIWTSELWATNTGEHRVELFTSYPVCTTDCAGKPFPAIEPGQTLKLDVPANGVNAGYLLWLQKGYAADVTLSLRIRDVSRSADNHGTEIPLPSVDDFQRRATLVNVPIDQRSRTTLRVYSDSGHLSTVDVRVEVTSLTGPEILASRVLTLREPIEEPGSVRGFHAQFATIGDLRAAFPELPDGNYRIIVKPLDPVFVLTVYPLASVTNNATQMVTAIAPR